MHLFMNTLKEFISIICYYKVLYYNSKHKSFEMETNKQINKTKQNKNGNRDKIHSKDNYRIFFCVRSFKYNSFCIHTYA